MVLRKLLLVFFVALSVAKCQGPVTHPNPTTFSGGMFDVSGMIFNCKSTLFGALGNGVTVDTISLNTCIDAAQGIGTVYLPKGNYIIGSSLHTLLAGTSLIGDSPYTTTISANTALTPVLGINNSIGYNGPTSGIYRNFTVDCHPGAAHGSGRQGTGILQTDSISLKYENIFIRNCNEDIELKNSQSFNESNVYDNLILNNYNVGIMFNWASAPGTASFAKDKFHISQFNNYAVGDAIIKVCPAGVCAGGVPSLYNETFDLYGNFSSTGASYAFDLTGGQQLVEDRIYISGENNGAGTPIIFNSSSNGSTTANQCSSVKACVIGSFAVIDVPGLINFASPIGSFASLMTNSLTTNSINVTTSVPNFIGILNTGAGTTDTITSNQPNIGDFTKCWAMPTNGGTMTGVFFSALTSNQVLTLTHPAGAGVTYAVFCL